MEYTEKIHAEALLKMLSCNNPCTHCPAHIAMDELMMNKEPPFLNNYCEICTEFINARPGCPCICFGKAYAIKRTWLALEEKGYI